MNRKEKKEALTIEIVAVIESSGSITQRHIAPRPDVALGRANKYVKRCTHKGLIRAQ